jgi:hypothetical protein
VVFGFSGDDMVIRLLFSGIVLVLSGCASVINDSTHPIKLETLTSSGAQIDGATCKLTNDYGVTTLKSGDTVQIRRSSRDLEIVCTQSDQPDAKARAISRGNVAFAGNIILGGVFGAVIDHAKGTAYTYPTWMQLVFGRTLVYDRRSEEDGKPVKGMTTDEALKSEGKAGLGGYNPMGAGCGQGAAPNCRQ